MTPEKKEKTPESSPSKHLGSLAEQIVSDIDTALDENDQWMRAEHIQYPKK